MNTRPDLSLYGGREHSYIKHYLLDDYIVALFHKVAKSYDHIVYVDGFSGPWKAIGATFADTSFGIALNAMRSAKAAWKEHGRDIQMTAHLVEKRRDAYQELLTLQPRFPDIQILPHHGDFVSLATGIASRIPTNAFAFILIDPKGFAIDMRQIQPLLKLSHCEVLFNFMFEFINRAASMSDVKLVQTLEALLPRTGWREGLRDADSPEARRAVLIDAFASTLQNMGAFTFVADTPVWRPIRDRHIYSLIYGTRSSKGIEVFRDSQIKTLRQQEEVRGAVKLSRSSSQSGQNELFQQAEMTPSDANKFLAAERTAAETGFLEMIPASPRTITYGKVWPRVLSDYVIRKIDVNQIAAEARRTKAVSFLDWAPRKQVPDDTYRMSRTSPTTTPISGAST